MRSGVKCNHESTRRHEEEPINAEATADHRSHWAKVVVSSWFRGCILHAIARNVREIPRKYTRLLSLAFAGSEIVIVSSAVIAATGILHS